MTKICFKCHTEKPLTEFYKHSEMKDGYLGKCKGCNKKDATEHRWKNVEKIREYDNGRSRLPHRRKMREEYCKQFRGLFPLKYQAYSLLSSAICCGRVTKPILCETCHKEKPLEGHHDDYNKPLDVRWLCRCCHRCLHRDLRKQIV